MVTNGERQVPQPVETQNTESLFSKTEKEFSRGMENLVRQSMSEYPAAANFVTAQMSRALTVPERASVARTSLVVYKEMVENPPEKDEWFREEGGSSVSLGVYIRVEEDDPKWRGENNNTIYDQVLKLEEYNPKLARYIIGCMNESVNVESASLVGKTSVILHDAMRYYMEFS
ncbi:hypothetical protein ACFL13_01870 [Patescibacteria group bacterium]